VISTIESAHRHPPQRGTQAAGGAILARVRPEDAGNVAAAYWVFVQREERQDALSGPREVDALPAAAELERARERQADLGARGDQHSDHLLTGVRRCSATASAKVP